MIVCRHKYQWPASGRGAKACAFNGRAQTEEEISTGGIGRRKQPRGVPADVHITVRLHGKAPGLRVVSGRGGTSAFEPVGEPCS